MRLNQLEEIKSLKQCLTRMVVRKLKNSTHATNYELVPMWHGGNETSNKTLTLRAELYCGDMVSEDH